VSSTLKIILIFFFISNCSFNSNSKFWTKEKSLKNEALTTNQEALFKKKKILQKELNPELKIKLKFDNTFTNNSNGANNDGIINFSSHLKKISKYKFSKIKYFDQFQPEIIFHNDHLIFFDNKGAIIKFDQNSKLIWKKNYYNKQEKQNHPILYFAKNNTTLIVVDSISKYYALNIETGEILWKKYNNAPFISDVKIHEDKFFVVDSNNVLSCISIIDGSLIWQHKSENNIIKSTKKLSIVIDKEKVIFNNSVGDVNALNIKNGHLMWITTTSDRLSSVKPFLLKLSQLVINKNSVLFSNNNNLFYSVNLETGLQNWTQNINSYLRPVIVNDLIFTITNEGYLVVIDNPTGNIIRITDVFNQFKAKQRNKIKPVGFVIGINNLFLSTDSGKLLVIDVLTGRTKSILKIDNNKISKPFISNKNLYLVKDDSIIKLK
jgi:outer membrane protein assembly factor BamB